MAPRALIVLNRGAGRRAEARRATILERLEGRYDIELLEDKGPALRRRLTESMERPPDLLVAAGGDGTVSSCAAAVRGTASALAIVPGGTANSIARALGIPQDLEGACDCLLSGAVRTIDCADVRAGGPRARPRSMVLMA
ncbi:MAG: hypothetical protein H5U40_03580, partial [Polyangiaceae bacterium]|nr:hypothetical protein [Polyangiaceae bacterium]